MFGKNSEYITDTPDGIEKLRRAIDEAEAVIIGAGAGLSTSAGFSYTGERLQKYFGDFVEKYCIPDMYSGGFMVMQLPPEINWAYWSRYIYINRYMNPPKPVYDNLYNLIDGRRNCEGDLHPKKDYFVITTNVDHCFQKTGFDKKRLFYTQGDYGLWQCSVPCHNKTYDNYEPVREMLLAQGFSFAEGGDLLPSAKGDVYNVDSDTIKMEVPTELIPRCPICGEPMTMNLRADDTFVQDEGWEKASERYSEFLGMRKNKKVLFLELSVGGNTPTIIKVPFIQMTYEWTDASYACLNLGEAFAPKELKDKSICINGDIGEILEELK